MPIKFNPATGRYENYNPQDGSYVPIGPGGQMVWNPNTDVPLNPNIGAPPTTTAPAPTYIPPSRTPAAPSGTPRGRGNRQSGQATPKRVRPPGTPAGPATPSTTAPSPSTTAPRATTTVPAPSTTAPRPTTTTAAPSPSTTAPRATTTTGVPAPSTTVPAKPSGGGRKSPATTNVGSRPSISAQDSLDTTVTSAVEEAFNSDDPTAIINALAALTAAQNGGDGDAAVDYANAYRSGIAGAKQQEAAALEAQRQYNQAAQTLYGTRTADIESRYAPQMTALENYYTGQSTAATEAINKAAQDALANIKDPTAFANLQALVGAAPQQGLGDALAAYGVTGNLAQQQAGTDTEYNKFLADLQNRSYQATQAANQDYTTALRNAITGSQAGSLQGLAQTIAGLRSQDVANLRGAQQQEMGSAASARDALIQAGLESLLSGQQTAAATRASTEQQYGAYKPKKSKSKSKKKSS